MIKAACSGSSNLSLPVQVALLALLLAGACASEQAYDITGRVVGFGDDRRTVIVEHTDVPGLMPAMTMPFTARDTSHIAGFRVGDAIRFTLHLRGDSAWIADVQALPDDAVPTRPAGAPDPAYPSSLQLLQAGDPVPNIRLQTHADSTLHLEDLRGQAVALTFVYTRCPLPDYCPRMTANFARLQEIVSRSPQAGRVHLLSISFDPKYDTPETLRAYAEEYGADLSSWTFATGDSTDIRRFAERFGIFYQSEDGEILHNLATAAIAPDGSVTRVWRGNEWTPRDVADVLTHARMYR